MTLSSNVNGDVVQGLLPNLATSQQNNTVTTGNLSSTWTTTAHPQYTTLQTNANRARLTGWRITVRYIGPEQTAAGIMYVGASNGFPTSLISTGLSTATPSMKAYSLKAGATYTFYAPMLGLPDFEKLDAVCFNNYWAGMLLIFRGLPASATGILAIRTERSVEYLPELSVASLIESDPEPYDPLLQAEAGILSGTAQSSSDDAGPGWARSIGAAMYNLYYGAANANRNAAREELRAHLRANRLHLMDG